MLPRTLTPILHRAIKTFPAIILTGPRQSGKTTLLKTEFGSSHTYLSLENPDVRLRAVSDPIGFLDQIAGPVIIDEFQYVPQLLPYIKTAIDSDRQPGRWLLTGSQNFLLMESITESLAGRAAILSLLPFSLSERAGLGKESLSAESLFATPIVSHDKPCPLTTILLRGNYPEISSNTQVDRNLWCSSYITTYLERDIRNLRQVGDLGQFEIFLRAIAARTAQILDLSAVSREIGISFTTAKRWLSLLQTGYQILLLYPYYKNIGKRLVKRPKIYFLDTGLVSYLLGLHTPEILTSSSLFGPLFETLVVTDFYKRFLHHGHPPSMYYLRTQDGLEVDLVIELGTSLFLLDTKSSATISPGQTSQLIRAQKYFPNQIQKMFIISNSSQSFELPHHITNLPISSL